MTTYHVFVGSIQQETNSFSPTTSEISDFDFVQGANALQRLAIEPLLRSDVILTPGIYAHAVPSGRMRRAVFDALLQALLDTLTIPVDGVLLYLHGALDVEGLGSGDAQIVRAVRAKVGAGVKIAVAMDFHANVSPVLMEEADVACAYRTAPHVDMEETVRNACRLLMDMLERDFSPCACMVRVPIRFTGDCVITQNEPARTLMHQLAEMEQESGVFSLSLCFGQPWVDTPWVGTCVLAYADTKAHARAAAERLGKAWWDARRDFRFLTETCMPEEAYARALSGGVFPVFLSDSGDNTTAGAAGDRAGMLRLAVESGEAGILIAGLTDAAAVQACFEAGEGASVSLRVGASLDHGHADCQEGVFRVTHLGHILGWYGEDAGRAVIARTGKVDVILTEMRCAVTSPDIIASVGLSMADYRVIVVKLGYLYPKLAAVVKRALFVMTDGASTARIDHIEYQQASRAAYPIDPTLQYNLDEATYEKGRARG